MNKYIENLQTNIRSYREKIVHHKVYSSIKNPEDLRIFMQYHVYAVWDFMSLLKALQNSLTCTTIPWYPKGDANTRFLINEIVVAEESDLDADGHRKSHFEIYLDAMNQAGADTKSIEKFINELKKSGQLKSAYEAGSAPSSVINFVDFTFSIINTHKPHLQAAIFTFGREDLIPGMFHSIINEMSIKFPESISQFKYYLERHIEIDGDHHSRLALQMVSNLCCTDEQYWEEATNVSIECLKKRIALWDEAHQTIVKNQLSVSA
ncbi:MAG: DUF3050 domain-containing protein [Ferruginibacter sp.]|nr:DUF3050 domain-containing protein [Ferruginibacter sp.]